jgi:hypothetical protein
VVVEAAIVLIFIALLAFAAVQFFGGGVGATWDGVADDVQHAPTVSNPGGGWAGGGGSGGGGSGGGGPAGTIIVTSTTTLP